MIKSLLISSIGLAVLASQGYAYGQSSNQRWECALDLHQGDKGTLSLNKDGDNVNGMIQFSRNENVFDSDVSGSWVGNQIDLIRLVGADSTEQMAGVVVALGTEKVNIGGRYSVGYQGVWSANCDLVSESKTSEKVQSKPFTSTNVTPEMPTDKQKVTFSVSASHPSGVKQISIFLGSDKIHTCDSNECTFSYGPLPKGIYSWRVEGLSNDGSISSESGRLVFQSSTAVAKLVASPRKVSNCRISGRATGASAPLAQIYSVKLYGPNSKTILRTSSNFNNGVYQFANLPEGQYQLTVDTKADQEILVSPATKVLSCKTNSALTQDFSFN